MKEAAEYQRYAEICRKLSLDASDRVAKRQLMEMATVWTLLADDRRQRLERQFDYTSSNAACNLPR